MPHPLELLPASAVDGARRSVRAALQRHRDTAPPAVKKATKIVRGRGAVAEPTAAGEAFEIEVTDTEGTERVRIGWGDGDVRCTCPTLARLGTCHHALGALEELFRALHSAPPAREAPAAAPKGDDYLTRLERIGAALNADRRAQVLASPDGDPWSSAALGASEVRYVVHALERRGEHVLRLEAQTRDAGGDTWTAVPFAVRDGARDAAPLSAYGPRHAAVAAVATGAADAARAAGAEFARTVELASLERALLPSILTAAHAAGPLLLRTGGALRPLGLVLDAPARLVLRIAEESRSAFTLTGVWCFADGTEFALDAALALSADGALILSTGDAARACLVDAPSARHVARELCASPLEVPRDDATALTSLAGVATLDGEALRAAANPVAPVAHLRVEAPEERTGGHAMRCTIEFDYGGTRVRYSQLDEVVPSLDGRLVPRQRAFEDTAIGRFFELGARRTRSIAALDHDATITASRFPGLVLTLLDEGWRVVAEGVTLEPLGSTNISVASGIDWFDLVGDVQFGDEDVPFPRVLRAAREGQRYVELSNGNRGVLPDRWLERWRLATLGEETPEGDGLRFERETAWALKELADENGAALDRRFLEIRDSFDALGAPRAEAATPDFQGTLRPYQREGLGWLRMLDRVGLSGLLADDMGLGKTVQILAWLASRRLGDPNARFLVVAPRSLVFNWIAEAERFLPDLCAIDFSGAGRWERFERAPEGALLMVTTYGTLRNDAERLAEEVEFDAVILDEAHVIKNRESRTAVAARALRARRRVSLTGTPIENRLGELWSQLEFLNPGVLGGGTPFARLAAQKDSLDVSDEARAVLARALRPIALRRTKDKVLGDLPPKTEQVLRAPLGEAQRRTYEEIAEYYRFELTRSNHDRKEMRLEDPSRPEINVLAALTRLRQAACHPGLVDRAMLAERSGKLDLLMPMLEDIVASGGKALCFSAFTGLLGLVRTRLETARVPYLVLDGSTRDRGKLVERFQNAPDGLVFLISLKAGGAGLNLTAADYVFLLDPWWNPAAEAQAIDRAHRIGRTRPVHVYRMVTEGTVESRVLELQAKKRELAAAVLGGAAKDLSGLGTSDLRYLLGV